MTSASTTRPWLSITPAPAHSTPPFTLRYTDMLSLFHHAREQSDTQAALHYFDQTINYAQLNHYSDQFAAYLLANGLQKGERVALYLQNIPQFTICALGIWKAGAVGVSINPMNRAHELTQLLRDSDSSTLILHRNLYEQVAREVLQELPHVQAIVTSSKDFQSRNDLRIIKPDDDTAACPGAIDLLEILQATYTEEYVAPLIKQADQHAPAMLVYTSGTTGVPKGAIITHGNLSADAQIYRAWIDIPDGAAILAMSPLFHVTGLVGHLALAFACSSATVLMCRFQPEVVAEATQEYQPQFVVGAITAFIALMNHPKVSTKQLSSLKRVYTGGAPVPAVLAAEFETKFGVPLRNCYGLTESTALALSVPPSQNTPVDADGAFSIGIPVFCTDAYIADEQGTPLAPDEIGEIMLRGPQIIPGYWNKPAESQASFINGYLKTGDVGYMNDAGWFFLVDRKKDMIIASGYKVWPKEVEDVIYSHPAVLEAAVVGMADPYRGETVKAVISLKPGHNVTSEALTDYCKQRLAAYKYPRVIEIVDELPKTVTGKILRRLLRN